MSKPLIELCSGAFFDPEGDLDDITGISIEDLATGLGGLCRYGGHTPCHYSVAEHAYLMSFAIPKKFALEALHHDSAEALGLNDIHGPLKKVLGEGVKAYERRANWRIAVAFGLDPLFAEFPIIKAYDAHMLKTESRAMMRSGGKGKGWYYPPRTRYLDITLQYWNRDDAAEAFLIRHEELMWTRAKKSS
jgi:hypothetical protein